MSSSRSLEDVERDMSRVFLALEKVMIATSDVNFHGLEMVSLHKTLQRLDKDIKTFSQSSGSCQASSDVACTVYRDALIVQTHADAHEIQFRNITADKVFDDWENAMQALSLLHLLPYIPVASLLLFTYFWKRDAACYFCSRGGSLRGTAALLASTFLWLISFAGTNLLMIASAAIYLQSTSVKIKMVFVDEPSVKAFIDHAQERQVAFWDIAFRETSYALGWAVRSVACFTLFHFMVFFYGCFVVLCWPYVDVYGDTDMVVQTSTAPDDDDEHEILAFEQTEGRWLTMAAEICFVVLCWPYVDVHRDTDTVPAFGRSVRDGDDENRAMHVSTVRDSDDELENYSI
eukprot:CAMPEP_0170594910 /NCGR_PEP_ID=MMETSP0224-20130122/14260_1 /TAXON_ID=285029 /ORGANISM="Togula jolla, Strain CCCM 725" /LENGTH=345 /DNA_ID=CAMNT_0010919015 /DNA_START=269 /DNA_END=1307 /DNA_ORIENTATION=-